MTIICDAMRPHVSLVILAALTALTLSACRRDETLSGYGASGIVWALVELDGKPFTARATLTFPQQGKITGTAPCNGYFASQNAPYPWFKAGPIGTTKTTCPDLNSERLFLSALKQTTLAEIAGDVLILSDDSGREMLFRPAHGG